MTKYCNILKIYLATVLLLLNGFLCLCSDSLFCKNLSELQSDTSRIRIYLTLCANSKDNTEGVAYADSAMAIAKSIGDSLQVAYSAFQAGTKYWALAQFDKALLYALEGQQYGGDAYTKAQLLFIEGNVYTRYSQYEKALERYNAMDEFLAHLPDTRFYSRVCNNRGVAYMNMNNLGKALESFKLAEKLFHENKDIQGMSSTCLNIAFIYKNLSQPEKELEYHLKNLKLGEETKNNSILSTTYLELMNFYANLEDFEQADKYTAKFIELPEENETPFFVCEKYRKLGNYYRKRGLNKLAQQFMEKSLAIAQKMNVPRNIAVSHNALASFYYDTEPLADSVLLHAAQALETASQTGDVKTEAIACIWLARYHYDAATDFATATRYAHTAYLKAKEVNYAVLEHDAAKLLGHCYEMLSEYQQALIYERISTQMRDSIASNENVREIARLSSQMEYEKIEAELDEQHNKVKNMRNIGVMLAVALFFMTLLVMVNRKNLRARKHTNQKLHEQQEELQAYNEELYATNDELSRIQQELREHHEMLEQTVTSRTMDLKQALVKVQESDQLKAAFFANLSHEIRTPLNAILGFLQYIDDPTIEADQRKVMIELVNSNAMQLLWMIEDVVTLSQIDSGILDIKPRKIDIENLLTKIENDAKDLQLQIGKSHLQLQVINKTPLVKSICIDEGKIDVLSRIINNAIKFTHEGHVKIFFEANEFASTVSFTVEDSGIGIPSEDMPNIFLRFWKQGDLFVQSYRGLGIGLSLCEETVSLMKGRILVASETGKGSQFRITVTTQQPDEV